MYHIKIMFPNLLLISPSHNFCHPSLTGQFPNRCFPPELRGHGKKSSSNRFPIWTCPSYICSYLLYLNSYQLINKNDLNLACSLILNFLGEVNMLILWPDYLMLPWKLPQFLLIFIMIYKSFVVQILARYCSPSTICCHH